MSLCKEIHFLFDVVIWKAKWLRQQFFVENKFVNIVLNSETAPAFSKTVDFSVRPEGVPERFSLATGREILILQAQHS